MASFVIPTPPVVSLPIMETNSLFPVRRVYCIGRNYGAHAIEMGHNPTKEPPFFFQKNPNNLNCSGIFIYPPNSNEVHYEAELAIMLKSGGTNISVDHALDNIYGYAPSLDVTRRDLQSAQKKLGRPWEIGKAFEHSAPVGLIHPVEKVGHPTTDELSMKVNGAEVQKGNLSQMIWKVPEIISYLSIYFELAAGDVILSGTPAGVGPITIGDLMEVKIGNLKSLTVKVITEEI